MYRTYEELMNDFHVLKEITVSSHELKILILQLQEIRIRDPNFEVVQELEKAIITLINASCIKNQDICNIKLIYYNHTSFDSMHNKQNQDFKRIVQLVSRVGHEIENQERLIIEFNNIVTLGSNTQIEQIRKHEINNLLKISYAWVIKQYREFTLAG